MGIRMGVMIPSTPSLAPPNNNPNIPNNNNINIIETKKRPFNAIITNNNILSNNNNINSNISTPNNSSGTVVMIPMTGTPAQYPMSNSNNNNNLSSNALKKKLKKSKDKDKKSKKAKSKLSNSGATALAKFDPRKIALSNSSNNNNLIRSSTMDPILLSPLANRPELDMKLNQQILNSPQLLTLRNKMHKIASQSGLLHVSNDSVDLMMKSVEVSQAKLTFRCYLHCYNNKNDYR